MRDVQTGVRLSVCAGFLVCVAAVANGQVAVGVDSASIPIQVYDRMLPGYTAPISASIAVRGLAADDLQRVFYISTGPALYRLNYDPPHVPVFVGFYSGAVLGISGGLAWDSTRGRLYGTTTSALYEINPTTAVTTLTRAFSAGDFGGLDYDAGTDRLYAANDSTATAGGLAGRGIYTVVPPYATGAITRIAPYPERATGLEETDIDGLAVGDGRVFLCADETSWMYTWNLATQAYEPRVSQTAFGADRGFAGATWAPGLLRFDVHDVRAAIAAPPTCTIGEGGTIRYTATITNAGSLPVSGVEAILTLPVGGVFLGSSPAGVLSGGVLRVALGAMGASSNRVITLDVLAPTPGAFACRVDATLLEVDPVPGNNTAIASTSVGATLPTQAPATGVLSTLVTSPTSLVPGLGGARFSNTTASLGRPYASPDTSRFILWADTDIADTTTDAVLVVWDGTLRVVARESTSPLLPMVGGSYPPLVFNPVQAINNQGNYAFSGLDARPSTVSDGFVVKVVNGVVQVVAQEDITPAPGVGAGIYFGALRGSVGINAFDRTSFVSSLSGEGVSAATDAVLVVDDGLLVLARKGLTVPQGQQDGFGGVTAHTFKSFDFGSISTGFSADGAGFAYSAAGAINASTVNPPTSGVDRVIVQGAGGAPDVILQENVSTPWLLSPPADINPFSFNFTDAAGVTVIIGTSRDGTDFVLRDGAMVALRGQPITPGSTETWSDASWAPGFFHALTNARGDYAVGGTTSEPDVLRNSAVVLNGTRVIARENDPVDLDANGVFDDAVFIRSFLEHRAFLGDDALWCVVRLRSAASASGCAIDTDLGQALIRVPLGTGCPACIADFNGSGGTPDDADVTDFFAAWNAGDACADANASGGTPDDADVALFFALWNAGGC
ncbi:MAG: hypothetical protein IPM33_05870 [Phycisphaerales bacterium]|nr:hypothetical protein [Phycisphaerales bacterium]